MPHEKLVYWGKYDIENLSRLRRNIEVDDLMHRVVLNINLLKLISFHAHVLGNRNRRSFWLS